MMLRMRSRYCNIRMRRFRRPSALGSGWYKPPLEHYFFVHLFGRLGGKRLVVVRRRVDNDYDTLAVASECKCCSLTSYSSS